jgi:hypothetical protein
MLGIDLKYYPIRLRCLQPCAELMALSLESIKQFMLSKTGFAPFNI